MEVFRDSCFRSVFVFLLGKNGSVRLKQLVQDT